LKNLRTQLSDEYCCYDIMRNINVNNL